MAIFCAYVERRDAVIKRSLQKNITRPMPAIPSFPSELHSNVDEKEVGIVSDNEREEAAKPTLAPPADDIAAVPPPSTKQMIEKDREINRIIDDLTKFDDAEDDVPIHSLKWKTRYKHVAHKSTCSN
ncbi:hypothetical protein PVK06_004800 [Gossypium arboreum]|uniref:Uncharacterized protein n=1 Tax=Gossypium arboreum TaxID=29729 RepID=A0ABR0QTF1_GOSAR|nr:hypothetical protein PVK06_004800 [Gossypium arboreum]